MHDVEVIVVGESPPEAPPHPAMEPIWPKVRLVLRHYAWFNADESRVRDMQHGILMSGALIAPSLYHEGGDLCRSSFYIRNSVFYRFCSGLQEYFWITSQLDRCYSLGALYFPTQGVALALYPYTIDVDLLSGFERVRTELRRPQIPSSAPASSPCVVVGYHHIIHHLWNELPALDQAIGAGLGSKLQVIARQQPLGPLDELFPELQGRVEVRTDAQILALHERVEMFTALGAWSIPPTTQARIVRVARQHAAPNVREEQERFRARHWPVFWLSVKPPQRTCTDQAAVLTALMVAVQDRYPDAGFLLNGVSFPWDYDSSSNYMVWFRDILSRASVETEAIMKGLAARLPERLQACVRTVADVPILEEINWACIVDFYVCHGGSMQNKVGWLLSTPGVIHSNTSFMASVRGMIPPVQWAATSTCYVPDIMVVDDDPGKYSPLELARKDQNYRFASIEEFTAFVLGEFDARVPHLDRAARPPDALSSAFDDCTIEENVPPLYASDEARISIALRSRDCETLPKAVDAGRVLVENGVRVQVMHNGLRVVADGYCGAWMTRLIERCSGHHEPQEEKVFHEVMRFMPDNAGMIELGGYWSYYSLWFLQNAPKRRAVVLEPDPRNLELGRRNAALNGLEPEFIEGLIGGTPAGSVLFATETLGELPVRRFTVEELLEERALDHLDILHCDTQGAELDVLRSCVALFEAHRIDWVFVSTHAEAITGDTLTHQRCLALLQAAGAAIEAEHEVHESFSGDGLIVARFAPPPAGWSPVSLSFNRYSQSLFRNPLYDLALCRQAARRAFRVP